MKTPVLSVTKPFDGNLYFYPANLSLTEGKYLFMVVSARKNIDDEVIKFYTFWLAKAVSIYKFENSNNLKLLQILSDLMEEAGSSYFFWEHEITGCVIVHNINNVAKVENYGKISACMHGMSVSITWKSEKSKEVIATLEFKSYDEPDPTKEKKSRNWLGDIVNMFSLQKNQNLLPKALVSIISNPTVRKFGLMIFWLIVGILAYFLFTILLNPLIR